MRGAPHRLTLTAAETAVLLRACPFDLPPGFGDPATGKPPTKGPASASESIVDGEAPAFDESVLRRAAGALAARGVLVSDDPDTPRATPPVAVNVDILAAPVVSVRVEVTHQRAGVRAYFATSGPLGASLFVLAAGGYELSMFPAVALGTELIRAVPEPGEMVTDRARIRAALGGHDAPPLEGELPLSALGEYDLARRLSGADGADDVAGALALTAAQVAVAERVRDLTDGVLWALAAGRHGDGILVGQVVWLATDQGWVEARPDADGSTRRVVGLHPVAREDLGVRLAPYVSEILRSHNEENDGRR